MNGHLAAIPASFTSGRRWFVFATEPGREKLADASIRATGLPVFVPYEKRIRRVRNRRQVQEYALFTGYGFVQFDINLDHWGSVVDAKGVVDLLRMNRVPVPVSDTVVDGLRVADEAGVFDHTAPPKAGTAVQVSDGPFAELMGKVKRARAADRMDVLLDFLGKQITATIPLSMLRPI